ncbi:hypothetical protein PAHAL_7G134400 [Panicum hallii]|uniref:Uncharacterized protein n=1 Tax=Panicum hallii TaxID=206008 RepID=A0A2T8IC27_9POAL|nr:hypothetical protein PAHAL_7G134400 [Panicum hallii]
MPPPLVRLPPKSAHALARRRINPCARRLIYPPERSLQPPAAGSGHCCHIRLPFPRCTATTSPCRVVPLPLPHTSSSARCGGPASVVPSAAVPLTPSSPPSAVAVPLAPRWLWVVGERRGGGGEGGATRSALSQPPRAVMTPPDGRRKGWGGRRERRGRAVGERSEGDAAREEGIGGREKEAGGLCRGRSGA